MGDMIWQAMLETQIFQESIVVCSFRGADSIGFCIEAGKTTPRKDDDHAHTLAAQLIGDPDANAQCIGKDQPLFLFARLNTALFVALYLQSLPPGQAVEPVSQVSVPG